MAERRVMDVSVRSPLVPLHVLDTDVDIVLRGDSAEMLAEEVRTRWHLAVRAEATPPARPPLQLEAELLGADDDPSARASWARDQTVVRDASLPRLLQRLTQSVTHAVITARTGDLLMLHAAAVADPVTGATAAFVAPGNTGKTTLCRTLGPARSYVTDETLGLRRDGTIATYPKPLSLRLPELMGTKEEAPPGRFGLRPPPVTPWLAGVVLLERAEGHAGPPRVDELDVLDAVLALTPESSGFMHTEGPLRWAAEVLERTGGARRVVYTEASDLEPLTAEICGRGNPW